MILGGSRKIEIVFNEYTDKKYSENSGYPVRFIERIILYDGEEIYRDKQNSQLYLQDKSLLSQLEDWVTGSYSPPEQAKYCGNVCTKCRNYRCFFCKFRFKLFRKHFKFKF